MWFFLDMKSTITFESPNTDTCWISRKRQNFKSPGRAIASALLLEPEPPFQWMEKWVFSFIIMIKPHPHTPSCSSKLDFCGRASKLAEILSMISEHEELEPLKMLKLRHFQMFHRERIKILHHVSFCSLFLGLTISVCPFYVKWKSSVASK